MQDSESGSSTAVAFALAGVLFIGAITTVLVYTNDRIPPPAKTRPHEEYGSEAHVLLQSLVLSCGTAPWNATTVKWTESASSTSVNNVPGLQYDPTPDTAACEDPGSACASPVCLDYARIAKLEAAATGTEPPFDGTYDYDDLRAILDLDTAERHIRIVIVDLNASEEVLLDYGEPIPGRTATQPATSYVELQHAGARDRHIARVSVHVFHS